MKRKSGSVFARWERKPRVPKWRRTNTQPPAPADLRLASWCPGNAPAAKTTERRISNVARGAPPPEKNGAPRKGGPIFFFIFASGTTLSHGAGAPAPYFFFLLELH